MDAWTPIPSHPRDLAASSIHTPNSIHRQHAHIHTHRLEWLGVPPPYPEPDQIALCVTAVATTLVLYFLLFGKRHRRRRKMLAKDLREARRRVQELEEKLLEVGVGGARRCLLVGCVSFLFICLIF
jgi:hypothetical protein